MIANRIAIDPQAQQVLDQIAAAAAHAPRPDRPPTLAERVAATRDGYAKAAQMAGEPEPVASISDRSIGGPSGRVPIRIYDAAPAAHARPALMWLHGGSFIAGSLDTHDRPLRALSRRVGFPVVAVGWRLAPEHPYPAGLEDAYAVLAWLATNGSSSPAVDPARIAVGGDSAGGALAAALTLMARAAGAPAIARQVLLYPNTDLAGDGSAYRSWAEHDGRVLTRSEMEWNFALYAGKVDRSLPGLSPIRSEDLSRLPPAFVVTGEADPQRDEGEAYAARLREAGVAVDQIRYPGMIHGFFQMAGVIDAGRDLIGATAAWLAPLASAAAPRSAA